jgi:hypothetical protein
MLMAINVCDNHPKCGNHARYVTTEGKTLCSLCSMEVPGTVAVRICDLPRFIHLAQTLARKDQSPEAKELLRYLPYDY